MDIRDAKRIVVLNLIPNTIGDSLYLIGLTRVLQKNVPDARITLTCANLTCELLQREPSIHELKALPLLNEIGKGIPRVKKAWLYLKLMSQLYSYLRRGRFDACIVTLPLFAPAQLLPFLARIPLRAGYTFKGSVFSFLLTHKTPARGATYSGEASRPFRETTLDLCRLLGMEFTSDDVRVRYTPSPDESLRADALLARLPKKRFVAFQAGGKWPNKCWPPERFAELGARMARKYDVHILLTGSAGEFGLNEGIRERLGAHATNLCTGVDLGTLGGVLKRCSLLVGNTSGILHFASAVGIPTVGLHLINDPRESEPHGIGPTISVAGTGFCGDPVCERNKHPVFNRGCRHDVSVERVWTAVDKELSRS